MAAGILPSPGTQYGPCAQPCKHQDCRQTRDDACTPCRFCTDPIGYGTRYVRARLTGVLAHERCLERAVDRNDARVGEF